MQIAQKVALQKLIDQQQQQQLQQQENLIAKKNFLKDSKWKKIRELDVQNYQNLIETVKAGATQEGASSESAKNFAILKRYTTKQIKQISVSKKDQLEDDRAKSVVMNIQQLDLENIQTEEEEKTSSDSDNESQQPVNESRQSIENDQAQMADKQSEVDIMLENFIKNYQTAEGGPYENQVERESAKQVASDFKILSEQKTPIEPQHSRQPSAPTKQSLNRRETMGSS